jgi:phospholipid transport system substrate-binding protein
MFRFLLSLLLLLPQIVYAETAISSSEARLWANTKGQELIQALSEKNLAVKYDRLDKLMDENVNLDYVSKFVIGKYRRKMTPEQATTYNQLFHRYVKSLYKTTDLSFDAQTISFKINSVTEHEKFASVVCIVTPPKLEKNIEIQDIPIKFKLIRGDKRKIQAVDVEISDISMVIEYRKRFYQMIKNEGENIGWFLEKFEAQVKANEENAEAKLNGTV